MDKLKGKIYWVLDDFSYVGEWNQKNEDTSHAVARIDNVIIEDYMLKFTVLPYNVGGVDYSYKVNLILNQSGKRFDGTFYEVGDPETLGKVYCEHFQNSRKHMLYGQWEENEELYTWWAIIE